MRLIAAACAVVVCIFAGCANSSNKEFQFGLIGDVPYTDFDATNAFPAMIAEMNQEDLAFVVHDGDIKSGGTPCTDEIFLERYRQFQTFNHPFILVFGDNEWTDCGRNPPTSPEERLNRLRQIFCTNENTLGKRTFKLQRQSDGKEHSDFRENVRWNMGGVMFVGLNIVGSHNNYNRRGFKPRNAANLAWLRDSFALANKQNAAGVMVIIQGNPLFDLPATNRTRLGYNDFVELLTKETIAFKKPVVLVHGDTHYFRIDKPMMHPVTKKRVDNFTRVETFGYPDVHWVRARVNADDPNVFSFRAELVKANKVPFSPVRAFLNESN